MAVIKVLFVCMGNICRSPMADGLFQKMVTEAGLADRIIVDSAGTGSWHAGEQAHPGTRDILKKHGINYTGRARQITRADLDHFDYVLAMDEDNLSHILRLVDGKNAQPEIAKFLGYARRAGTVDVDDVPGRLVELL